ncbi:MAG: leucine--tRNA ligase [Planctomycetes bacterium]|nr:leucine--tRNA ligase [Planctomycetota bacterium]
MDDRVLDAEERADTLHSLLHWDSKRCQVYAACVMPDHVHWIVRPFEGESISKLTPSVKRFSARRINERCGAKGAVWHEDRFDHIIRDERWFAEFLRYLVRNPVEAGLCELPTDYPFSFVSGDIREEDGVSLSLTQGSRFGESTYLYVYTTRPDTIFGATYMVVAPEHELVEAVLDNPTSQTDVEALRSYVDAARDRSDVERQENKDKTGVFTGVYCLNPATNKRIPIWVADYVLMGYGTGAIMAVPGQDERDWAFAEAFGLPIVRTVQPPDDFDGRAYIGQGVAINSDFLDGLDIADAKARIIDWLEDKGVGERTVNFKLRDWLFSRQRYWGEPFPIVWDEDGHHHAIGESTLPLALPPLTDYAPQESDTPKPLLAKAHDWVKTTAGEAGVDDGPWGLPASAKVTRETNTMPGWAGSCWYFLRYCDNRNADRFVGTDAERYWMGDTGVDLYIGGAEHAVLHLLYARFWHKVLFDLGHVGTDEPFKKLFHQGMITSFAYQREDKSLVAVDEVEEVSENQFIETATGKAVTQTTAKMSKTLKNVVNPDDVIAEFGADTFRLYEMYLGPLEASAPWNPRDIVGLYRFLQRVWRLVVDEDTGELVCIDDANDTVEKQLHRTIAKVGGDIERISLNTAIAAMIQFVNTASSEGGLTRDQTDRFVRTLSPFAPHIAEEIWSKLGNEGSIAHTAWPSYDESKLVDDEIEIPVQIMGKVRSRIMAPADADEQALEKLALADSKIAALIQGKTVHKIVVVPGRMVNIVAN